MCMFTENDDDTGEPIARVSKGKNMAFTIPQFPKARHLVTGD